MVIVNQELETSKYSVRDRLEQLCAKFTNLITDLPQIVEFYESRQKIRLEYESLKSGDKDVPTINKSGPAAQLLEDSSHPLDRLPTYEAWCFLLRTAIMNRQRALATNLVSWMKEYHERYPPEGVIGIVERTRLYLTLRIAANSKSIDSTQRENAVVIVSSRQLSPLLPFMVVRGDIDALNHMLTKLFDHYKDPNLLDLTEEEAGLKSCQGNGGNMTELGKFDNSIYRTVGTLDAALLMRQLTQSMPAVKFCLFDKQVLQASSRNTMTRSATYTSFMTYLQSLERNADQVVDVNEKFYTVSKAFMSCITSFPPSMSTAELFHRFTLELLSESGEMEHSEDLQLMISSLHVESKRIMSNSYASLRMASIHSVPQIGQQLRRRSQGIRRSSAFDTMRESALTEEAEYQTRHSSVAALRSSSINTSSISLHNTVDNVGPTSCTYNSDFFAEAPSSVMVALVPNVWLQIDPDLESLNSNNPDVIGHSEMTSVQTGRLRIYCNRISWVMTRPKRTIEQKMHEVEEQQKRAEIDSDEDGEESKASENNEDEHDEEDYDSESDFSFNAMDEDENEEEIGATRMPKPIVNLAAKRAQASKQRLKIGAYKVFPDTSSVVPGSYEAYAKEKEKGGMEFGALPKVSCPVGSEPRRELIRPTMRCIFSQDGSINFGDTDGGDEEEIEDSRFVLPITHIRRYTWGSLSESHSYLAIYTTEVVKLYPFSNSEIQEIMRAIHDISGLKPTPLGSHYETGFRQKIEHVRLRILDEEILPKNEDWISHTEELLHILKELTKGDTPIRMVDMERLYHSGRNNKAVIMESLSILKELWDEAKTQESMIKILAVLDRFLDGDILNGDDEILSDTLKWLHDIETTLDPYTNASCLKVLLNVCQRTESLQSQTIVPLVEVFYDENLFEMRELYKEYVNHCRRA